MLFGFALDQNFEKVSVPKKEKKNKKEKEKVHSNMHFFAHNRIPTKSSKLSFLRTPPSNQDFAWDVGIARTMSTFFCSNVLVQIWGVCQESNS